MFYNCGGDFFKRVTVENQNQNTNQLTDSYTATSICDNVFDYIQNGIASQGTSFPGEITNQQTGEAYIVLNYISNYENAGGNRQDSCGLDGGGTGQCSALKQSLWPIAVSDQKNLGKLATQDYKLIQGYTESMSCDEFPFGGSNPKTWGGSPRTFTLNLVHNTEGRPLAGGGDYSLTNSMPWSQVIGGINLQDNPNLTLNGKNAVCAIDGLGEKWDNGDKIYKHYFVGCFVIFISSAVPYKRDAPVNWEVEEVRLSDDWRETMIGVDEADLGDYLTDGVPDILRQGRTLPSEVHKKSDHLKHRSHARHHGH
ncbi:uncharacterized protein N7496_010298 [Penicillium cataractarum]|uniref:Uncharacterized protein n=1 Tax=Penicillium cataractarum TaxID=2100454 RepID=A0A9W9V2Y8_9EURO|nr:uncharacterized protein N7496_010298 [Penicillium cataractarum]KAJ5364585.1 hypothetical protein N7496_010298 [Penicillium cataractarum]